jgi:hypothetical protein
MKRSENSVFPVSALIVAATVFASFPTLPAGDSEGFVFTRSHRPAGVSQDEVEWGREHEL